MGSPSAFLRLAAIIKGVQPEPSCLPLVFAAESSLDGRGRQKREHRRTSTSGSKFLVETRSSTMGRWLYATAQWMGRRSSSSFVVASFGFA
jgi:hypothetical protein